MEFTNEIALTGELSEIGLPLRRNVDDSYRRGLEFDLRWSFVRDWTLLHSANLSRNRIASGPSSTTSTTRRAPGSAASRSPTETSTAADARSHSESGRRMDTRGIASVGLGALCRRGATRQHRSGRVPNSLRSPTSICGPPWVSGRWWPEAKPRTHPLRQQPVRQPWTSYPSGYSYQFLIQRQQRPSRPSTAFRSTTRWPPATRC